jgi:hypothetical protein
LNDSADSKSHFALTGFPVLGFNFLTMPLMALVLLAPVLPLHFALLNLCVRNGHNLCRQAFEPLEWRFLFWWLRLLHVVTVSFHDLERKTYTRDVPTAAIIKSVRNNRPQSIFLLVPSSVNRNE